jgi:transposase
MMVGYSTRTNATHCTTSEMWTMSVLKCNMNKKKEWTSKSQTEWQDGNSTDLKRRHAGVLPAIWQTDAEKRILKQHAVVVSD